MNIYIIFFSSVLLSALPGPAANNRKIIVHRGSSRTFYCKESVKIEKCNCKDSSCYIINDFTYKKESHLGHSKITVPYPSYGWDYFYCYRCGEQVYQFEVLKENCPSVVIGKPGGSVMMSCTGKWKSSESQYWCRKDQNRTCSQMKLSNSWRESHYSRSTYFFEKRDLSTADSGLYQCVLKSSTQNETCTTKLELLQTQDGLHAPTAFIVMPGQEARVACKYIQDYANATKFWECSSKLCSTDFEVEDDRSRSELVLSIANVTTADNFNVFTCKVTNSAGGFHSVSMTLIVGLTAPHSVTGTRGGRVKMRCQYKGFSDYGKYWCKLNSSGKCNTYFNEYTQYNNNKKWSFVEGSDYFDLIIERLQKDDAGSYRCIFYNTRVNYYRSPVKADVNLSIIEPLIPSTTTRKTVIERQTRNPTKIMMKEPETSVRSNFLLYGIFFLLTVIAFTLLMILLKLYCKRRSDRVHSPDLGGGTFQMNDFKTNIHLMSPDLPVHQQPYTGTMDDDSSSTSSESSGHSFGNISCGPRPQYLTIIPGPRNLDYENVSEEMHPALSDYENVTTDVDQDYVNVPEAPNSSFTEDKEDKEDKSVACQPTENCDENDNTSESSSDESDKESVNYSTVVFTKTTQ